jgi:hypothetical protein
MSLKYIYNVDWLSKLNQESPYSGMPLLDLGHNLKVKHNLNWITIAEKKRKVTCKAELALMTAQI